MKQVPNILTCFRILSSIILLFLRPLSWQFFLVYTLCGVTDIFDGYIARKAGVASKTGAILDSIADMAFIAAALLILIPAMPFKAWMIYWIIGIAFIRISSLVVGYVRYRSFAGLHTYANKATGLILFCFPYLYSMFEFNEISYFILTAASLSGVEEIVINSTSKSLNRDVKSIFSKLVSQK